MNPQRRPNDGNPYAAPETADRRILAAELPPGSDWKVDGDALLCCGDLTFDWLCFSTGLPVEPDAKVFYMKVFAPSEKRQFIFRLFHSFSIAALLLLLALGRIMQAGPVKIFGVPAFLFVLAYIAIFILILRRTASFRIYYRRSPEGRQRQLFRRTIPSIIAGLFALGPTLIVLPTIFAVSSVWGLTALCVAIAALAGFVLLLPEPRAISLRNGVYRVTYLAPELLAELKNVSPQC